MPSTTSATTARTSAAPCWRAWPRPQKRIPSTFFYDDAGSRLFDRICQLEEYYPTRTETALLERHASDLVGLVPAGATLVEFGSGASLKTRILLDGLPDLAAYVPIDISRGHLIGAARGLAADYPRLAVVPVCADYSRDFALPGELPRRATLGFFPGSTIGNFSPLEATAFLRRCTALLGPEGAMLIGVDLQKDPARLHAAYNDAAGVTAAFNLNLLARINRELGAAIDLGTFVHRAHYNEERACIEMHLVSKTTQDIEISELQFRFEAGETIHTEGLAQVHRGGLPALARAAGWRPVRAWCDPERLFSLHYLTA